MCAPSAKLLLSKKIAPSLSRRGAYHRGGGWDCWRGLLSLRTGHLLTPLLLLPFFLFLNLSFLILLFLLVLLDS